MQSRSLYFVTGLILLLVVGGGFFGMFALPRSEGRNGGAASTPVGDGTAVHVQGSTSTPAPNDIASAPTAVAADITATPLEEDNAVAQVTREPDLPPTGTPVPPTDTPVPPPTNTPTEVPPPPTATDIPLPPAAPERVGGPVTAPNNHPGPRWVTLQVGHWRNADLPDELKHLDGHTGASVGGVNEVDVNLEVAQITAGFLKERGYEVDILDATVPVSYTTDLFLALHADGNPSPSWRGFKAVAPWGSVPASDQFVGYLYEEYGKATGLPTDILTTDTMADYYAFSSVRYRHAITPDVPAALIEMGFITNPLDRVVLSTQQESLAWGIANGIDRWFRSGSAGPIPTMYPTFTATKTPTSTPTSTATVTHTSTATSTETATPTETPSMVPTELADLATQTALVTTPVPPSPTATVPAPTATTVPTATPSPTATPPRPIITEDGRWFAPRALNGRNLPQPGTNADPVYLNEETQYLPLSPDGREAVQVWQQFYMPELGRSVWQKGPLKYVRR